MESPRRAALRVIRETLRGIDNGKYFAKRGAINWIEFDFEANLYGVAIMVDSSDVGRCAPEADEMSLAAVSLELATRIPPDDDPEINDEILEGIYDDVEFLLDTLQAATNSQGDSIIFKLERSAASAIEFHDPQFRVQGIVVTFGITF